MVEESEWMRMERRRRDRGKGIGGTPVISMDLS